MSRKTIAKRSSHRFKKSGKFTSKTKRLCKKFTNKKRIFGRKSVIFVLCKWNLLIFTHCRPRKVSFCAYFCLFWHYQKPIFYFGKFDLPIFEEFKKMTLKVKIQHFCESCTILNAYFLHILGRKKGRQTGLQVSKSNVPFSKIQHFEEKQQNGAVSNLHLRQPLVGIVRFRQEASFFEAKGVQRYVEPRKRR